MKLIQAIALLSATFLPTVTAKNECGDSSFTNQSSGGSPTVADCQTLASNIDGDGKWTIDINSHQIAQFGTCAVSVEAKSGSPQTFVGNEDVQGIIQDSIRKFQTDDGLVGAKGNMDCQVPSPPGAHGGVEWGIYFNPDCCS